MNTFALLLLGFLAGVLLMAALGFAYYLRARRRVAAIRQEIAAGRMAHHMVNEAADHAFRRREVKVASVTGLPLKKPLAPDRRRG